MTLENLVELAALADASLTASLRYLDLTQAGVSTVRTSPSAAMNVCHWRIAPMTLTLTKRRDAPFAFVQPFDQPFSNMDNLLNCPVCYEPFDSDLSVFGSENERRESHLPVLSHQCPHKICAHCLNNWQLRAVSKRAKHLPKWFKCPCCAKKTAFDAEEMEIDTFACAMFAHVKANGTTVQSSSENSIRVGTKSIQSSEAFLGQGSARRTEYHHQQPFTQTPRMSNCYHFPYNNAVCDRRH